MKRLLLFALAVALFCVLGVSSAAATESSYLVFEDFGGDWADAEKSPTDPADDLACWAAGAANVLEWTGWGSVPGFEGTDDIFAAYVAAYPSVSSNPYPAWSWWFKGVGGGTFGGYWPEPPWVFADYASSVQASNPPVSSDPDMMLEAAERLRSGRGVTIWVAGGGQSHSLTLWGYNFDPAIDPMTDTEDYFKGIWVTSSSDDKFTLNPPDRLRYYEIVWDSTTASWIIQEAFFAGWYIGGVQSLDRYPNTIRPVADADGPYIVSEGSPVDFVGSGSTDADGDTLSYRWDFENDHSYETSWSPGWARSHTWNDDFLGQARILVSDGIMRDADTGEVTVENVPPYVSSIAVLQPNTEFVLAGTHELTFTASSTDPGSDDATFVWDFGDGGSATHVHYNDGVGPDPDSSHGGGPMSASDSAKHVYEAPGFYVVTVTVSDDDGGEMTTCTGVHVVDVADALDVTDAYIQALPATAFVEGKADSRKKALGKMFAAVDLMLARGAYNGAIDMLNDNLRTKSDGSLEGDPGDDWVVDATAQVRVCRQIDDISEHLMYLNLQ